MLETEQEQTKEKEREQEQVRMKERLASYEDRLRTWLFGAERKFHFHFDYNCDWERGPQSHRSAHVNETVAVTMLFYYFFLPSVSVIPRDLKNYTIANAKKLEWPYYYCKTLNFGHP